MQEKLEAVLFFDFSLTKILVCKWLSLVEGRKYKIALLLPVTTYEAGGGFELKLKNNLGLSRNKYLTRIVWKRLRFVIGICTHFV